uniref:hypothetical protein n=1 Tax=Candidatus Fimenecus sp. TaxID=3022888 RepID=UPI004028A047
YLAVTHAKTLRALGIGFFSIISGDSERECTGCTLSERPHERTEKDIPKVVSDGEINPKLHTFATAEAIRAKRRQILL